MHVPSFHQSAGPARAQAPRLWLIAGTGEGPRLAAALLQAGWQVRVCVVSRAAARAYAPQPGLELLVGAIGSSSPAATPLAEPALCVTPPADLRLQALDAATAEQLRGREVWLVHPWALRAPPADLPASAVVLGVYVADYHQLRPWSQARWRWVDAAMAQVAPQRCLVDAASLATALAGAARVRSVDDPHLTRWLGPLARLDAAPTLFPLVERRCDSFSQWWTRATRGLQSAGELL